MAKTPPHPAWSLNEKSVLSMRYLLAITVLASLAGCAFFATPLPVEQRVSVVPVNRVDASSIPVVERSSGSDRLRVLSLNMAHGRGDNFTQFLTSDAEIQRNLEQIATFLRRENADIVTLQEADADAWWSGNINQVEWLAREAGYRWYTQANHVDNFLGRYGTAVLSRHPIAQGYQVDFNPTPPTTNKGFTLAEINWSPMNRPLQTIDVVSVHLDFSRRANRIEQIRDMKSVLGERDNPTIVLGDFNTTWEDGDRQIQSLASTRQLSTHRPDANFLYTYGEARLDWILISRDFAFCQYHTAPDILSDHLAVISEIVLINEESPLMPCSA